LIAKIAAQGPSVGDAGAPLPCTSKAMVFADDAYGIPFSGAVEQRFVALKGTVTAKVKVPPDVKADYTAEAAQIIAALPASATQACVTVVTFGPTGAGFIKAFQTAIKGNTARDWTKVPVYGANALYTTTFINNARSDPSNPDSPSATEGMY